MSFALIVELAWKSGLIAAVTLILLVAARGRSAAEKSLLGEAGILSLLLLPLTILTLPRIEIAAPETLGYAFAGITYDSANPVVGGDVASTAVSTFDWEALLVGLYAIPLTVTCLMLIISLVRLQRLRNRARVLEDARWLTALASAQNRIGIKHGTLLVSQEVNSPISWGIMRPIIVINPQVHAELDCAESIIAHELAHVYRLDWAKLIAGRLASAIFWFNPLVWMLARRCHQLREEAADDAVLRMDVDKADYAELLVTAVRHANSRPLLAANGVAPSSSSIAKRVNHVLDGSRRRAPARLNFAAASLLLAGAVNAALAAAVPVSVTTSGIDRSAGERAAADLEAIGTTHSRVLARAIRNRDWDARRVDGRTPFQEARAVRPLMLALRDDHPIVRRIAVWGLSELRPEPGPVAVPAVSRLLEDPVAEVRAEAAGAIGDFQIVSNSRAVEKLLLRDPSPMVRLRAAHALGDIQDPGSRRALEAAAADPSPQVRAKAAWALLRVSEAERLMNR